MNTTRKKISKKLVQKTGKKEQCQCTSTCKRKVLNNSYFCELHQEKCPRISPLSGYEPDYDPKFWNSQYKIKETHNCFAYAFNINDPSQTEKCENENCDVPFHQPGMASGYKKFESAKPKTCPNIVARLFGDNPNIQMCTFQAQCPADSSKIALIVDENEDYHFLRQDSNGLWSHKPGARKVTNRDANNNLIYDPALANYNYKANNGYLNYDVFCSYLCVPRVTPVKLKVGGGNTITQTGGTTKTYKMVVLYNRNNDDTINLTSCMMDDWDVLYNGSSEQNDYEYETVFYGTDNIEEFYECLKSTLKDYKKNKVIKKFKIGILA